MVVPGEASGCFPGVRETAHDVKQRVKNSKVKP